MTVFLPDEREEKSDTKRRSHEGSGVRFIVLPPIDRRFHSLLQLAHIRAQVLARVADMRFYFTSGFTQVRSPFGSLMTEKGAPGSRHALSP